MSDFTAQIANCPLIGEQITRFPNGRWSRNVINLSLSHTKVTLIEHPDIVRKYTEWKDKQLHTTDLRIANVPDSKTAWAADVAQDVGWLLAFGAMAQIGMFAWSHGDKGESLGFTMGRIHYSHPIVSFSDGAAVRRLIESCWSRFRRLRKQRRLRQVIHYLAQTNAPDQPIEQKLLGAVVVLENLKATYARSTGIPYIKGAFRHPAPAGRPPEEGRPYRFHKLLELMLLEVGMKPALRRIVQVRNEIVHTGLSRRSFDALYAYYGKIQDLSRTYLLRLLGYRGEYYAFSDTCQPKRLDA